ncbi:MAG: hypothetical protein J7M38_09070 [Armatimonadetes bacterium]|nr:hypothetical protein [Armatimonadota bacterium]
MDVDSYGSAGTPCTGSEATKGLSSAVYWAHADDVLSHPATARWPYSQDDLEHVLVRDALFAETLLVLDICLLYNRPLRELLMYEGYDTLLHSQVVVPLLRSSAESFAQLEDETRRDPLMHGRPPRAEAELYANFLDGNCRAPKAFSTEQYSAQLAAAFRSSLLSPTFRDAFRLNAVAEELDAHVRDSLQHGHDTAARRSVFFGFADRLESEKHPRYAGRIRWLASTIYNSVITKLADATPAFPHTYTEAIRRLPCDGSQMAQHMTIDHSVLSDSVWLTETDLSVLRPEDVLELRQTREAKRYFGVLRKQARRDAPGVIQRALTQALIAYVGVVADHVAMRATRREWEYRAAAKRLQVIEWVTTAGSIGVSLAGLAAQPVALAAIPVGITWVIAGAIGIGQAKSQVQAVARDARAEWAAFRSALLEEPALVGRLTDAKTAVRPRF